MLSPYFRRLRLLSLLCCSACLSCFAQSAPPVIYIVLDDIGYRASDELAFELPTAVAFAILPHTLNAKPFAIRARAQGREIILHLPMSSLSDKALGPGAITTEMSAADTCNTLQAALLSVPNAIGINNHMGSVLTASHTAMSTFMACLKPTGLFFIDSRTTALSVAQQVATQQQIATARRHVFLDHQQTRIFMAAQWRRLLALARTQGSAIAIAHPHPKTLLFLLERLVALTPQEAVLRPISEHFLVQESL